MYDALVIGLGGMGSASLFQIANKGLKTLGIEQFGLSHTLGSSHGLTRIIRLAYFEAPAYVPLLLRAYELWTEIEQLCGEELLHITGSIDTGVEHSRIVKGALRSCREFSLPHELLDAQSINRRFPGYTLPPNMWGILQPRGGFLHPERCILSYVDAAQNVGAEVHTGEKVTGWVKTRSSIVVQTERGQYETARLVITAGPWASDLIPQLKSLAIPERQAVLWTVPLEPDLFRPERFPVFNLEAPDHDSMHFYGFPMFQVPGFKIGRYHHLRESGHPDDFNRSVGAEDEEILREGIRRFFPKANGPAIKAETCIFTNSPDEHFILDKLSDAPPIAVATGFSGHGFKFCSVVGEIMADLVINGSTRHNLSPFQLNRFGDSKL